MGAVFLACCVRGMEVTRHFTWWQSSQIVIWTGAVMALAALIWIGAPALRAWRDRG
jgi:hypothetical protein